MGDPKLTHACIRIADHARSYVCGSEALYCESESARVRERRIVCQATLTRRYRVIVQLVPLPRGEALEEAGNDLVEGTVDGWSRHRRKSACDTHMVASQTLFACACAATWTHLPSGSAPAPIAVRLMTSPHHPSAPLSYAGFSFWTCLNAAWRHVLCSDYAVRHVRMSRDGRTTGMGE